MLLFTILTILIISLFPRVIMQQYSKKRTKTLETAPEYAVAIVFGAGLERDGSPSPVLRDRVKTAVELYFAGKVEKILMSGDNRYVNYNEPVAMQRYALQLEVPEEDIVLDYAGRRTYDTCYRAKHIFKVPQAILVTQQFHLPRAIYTCNHLGLPAEGVPADQRVYYPVDHRFWKMREFPATLVALIQVHITQPEPVLGDPEPIFPEGQTTD
jgi:SanA protein